MVHVKMEQHAVGQGGLFSGELYFDSTRIRWVYDCGSNQPEALSREIGRVAADGKIDLLFLSHFDSDHINGIDQLLSLVDVSEVVLPYLDETTLIATIARDSARGVLRGTLVEAVSDLAGWFGRRGVERITFVDGRGDDDEGEDGGPDLPDESRGGGEVRTQWTREPERITGSGVIQSADSRIATMRKVAPGATLQLFESGVACNWVLIPYVHMPSKERMKAFEEALGKTFGSSLDKKQIVHIATEREKLRGCYDELWRDHNLVSMTLYSGPRNRNGVGGFNVTDPHRLDRDHWPYGYRGREPGGWMLTGDAHLGCQRRSRGFLQFYGNFMDLISVLMLPHHGSIHNHSDQVLDAMPNLKIGYAASGPNSYGHPHRNVRDAVKGHPGAKFHRVNDKNKTRLEVRVWVH